MSAFQHATSERPRSERNYALTRHGHSRLRTKRQLGRTRPKTNVGRNERWASLATGAALTALGVSRKSWPGLFLAGLGGGLIYRGATGHCSVYEAAGVDTSESMRRADGRRGPHPARHGIHVVESILINKPANELYDYWRNLENLPRIMSHLEAVHVLDGQRSHWVATAPRIVGGRVEWDAEIIRDEPGVRIAWRSLPGSDVDQRGMVSFLPAAGDRGVVVRADVEYRPPAGQIGHWVAKLMGDDPAQQIHDDLRNLKRTLETGEPITVAGQSRGNCLSLGDQA
jgi:uncharacterized membrane protein